MQKCNSQLPLLIVTAAIIGVGIAPAQQTNRPWMDSHLSPGDRSELVLKQLTLDEKLALVHGNGMSGESQWRMPLTPLTNGGAGYTQGVERLGIPPLIISDAGYGVRASGANGRYSTAMPSNLGAASSWDPESACQFGEVIGGELRAQGFDVTLGGGVNLTREPRNGRTFEYAGEDPLLAGTLVGNMMKCEQGQHVIGDIKHYAVNDQETGRFVVNSVISKRAMQESDLLAFHIAISIANPGAVMCSYNRINGDFGCENSYTLQDVLKKDWGFKGFVISDWGGTHSTEKASSAGLDQEQPMADYFGLKLKEAVDAGSVPLSEIDDHARRVLYAEFLAGIVDDPPHKGVVNIEKGLEVAQRIEEKSIVLLKNNQAVLPIIPSKVHSIAIIGGHADVGMISGGGSAQVDPPGGNAIMPPGKGGTHWQDHIWFPTSPLQALRAKLPNTTIEFNPGTDLRSAASLAKTADVAIVFAYQWESEGMDLPNLSLPDNQDSLIEQVAAANPHTIVILETGTAATMPWLDKVAGIVEVWYAGSAGHKALANILLGDVNPSGKLAMTFPKTEADLPRPSIAPLPPNDEGQGHYAVNSETRVSSYAVHYDEGSEVGYKWYEAQHKQPLFPFGFGLSYTSYAYSGLSVDSSTKTVRFTVKNTGKRTGTEIAEVYATLPKEADESFKRLVGWKRVTLAPGESQDVTVAIDPQELQTFDESKDTWMLTNGEYGILVGPSSESTPLRASLRIH
ncbi:glycoside hydrolase family 3 C-terminal domain-containing protein [Tunturiibacter gelidoferens]|uniref:glycoside hydrolase family 3 C-terminal domain-containing protein n=1 Tax=Tunturiibacter gelidiferens TaxID=3069689 RepID=UPI00160B36ED|nr:glycoside hydrolase family 3 C-terminal domain-containing protein [Edaphobacter lichenicola]